MPVEYYAMNELSLARAETLVPRAYLPAFKWFQEHEGKIGPRPWQQHKPDYVDITMVAQSGIHKPTRQRYAISITSSGYEAYSDKAANSQDDDRVHDQGDGTWIYNYCEHKGSYGGVSNNKYNEALLACFRDGIPVGVFIKQQGSEYLCLGLAFIEGYDSAIGMFSLHGPVNTSQDVKMWSLIPEEEFDEATKEIAQDFSFLNEDQRAIKVIEQVQREKQGAFRKNLLRAYEGTCAISKCSIEPTLQAAHISPYRGPKSQLTSNGLLLRADLHLLYDAYLLSICPDDMSVRMDDSISSTPYGEWNGRVLHLPTQVKDQPAEQLLETHFATFLTQCRI